MEEKSAMGTRSVLDREMTRIRDDILRMGSLVGEAVERSYRALRLQAAELAQDVVNGDDTLDFLCHDIERRIARTVALQQPTARDLRRLLADLLITNELERMGDHAEGIARTVLRYESETPIEIPPQLATMKSKVLDMLRQAMDAYAAEAATRAKEIARLDDEVDATYHDLFNRLINSMVKGRLPVEQGTYLLWAGHALERVGDRVTNICERVVYTRTGDVDDLNPKPGEG